ncbi:MAG: hypothetical protein JNJ85_15570 [Candidatus Kapabacteria bacterium]|nr:hypothetical protein [Candidatus Kapabacteria bacterium]
MRFNLVDSYYTLLKNLSPNHKLELISRLSQSMKSSQVDKDTSWKELFGALEVEQSAEEFVLSLKNDRVFTRKPIDL